MARPTIAPTGREVRFDDNEIIVSKTDLRGVITYANDVFARVSGYSRRELLGQPHNLIRHPAMPRCVFRVLWETLQDGREIFAYVINQARNGDHYWVFAHVTPSYDLDGRMVGYHSNRRVPYADALPAVQTLYAQLVAEEQRHAGPEDGIKASLAILHGALAQSGKTYGELVFSLSQHTRLQHAV